MTGKKFLLFVGCIALCFAAGAIGSLATTPAIPTWYANLTKPFFSPPNWVFGPVWSTLYLLMGIALYLVATTKTKKSKSEAYTYFFVQLALNSYWSIVFFGQKQITFALLVVLLLWLMIAFTIRAFKKINPQAALLLFPYIAWVSFASILNFAIVQLN